MSAWQKVVWRNVEREGGCDDRDARASERYEIQWEERDGLIDRCR